MTFILYLLRIIEINFLLPHQACRLMLPKYKEALLLWNIVLQQHRTRYLCLNLKVWMKFWQNNSIVYCLQVETLSPVSIFQIKLRGLFCSFIEIIDFRYYLLSGLFLSATLQTHVYFSCNKKTHNKKVRDAVLSCAVSQTLWHHTIIIALMISIDSLGCTDLTSSSNSNLLIRFEPENSSRFSCRTLFLAVSPEKSDWQGFCCYRRPVALESLDDKSVSSFPISSQTPICTNNAIFFHFTKQVACFL